MVDFDVYWEAGEVDIVVEVVALLLFLKKFLDLNLDRKKATTTRMIMKD